MEPRFFLRTSRFPLIAALALAAGASARAPRADEGPGGPPFGARPDGVGAEGPRSPEDARAFVQRRLEMVREESRRLEEALRMLESGASPDEVRRAIGPAQEPGADGPGGRPGPMPRRGPGGPPGGHDRLPPEAQARIMEFLREHNPQAADKIEALRAERPMMADRMLAELGGQLHELRELRERNPKMFPVRLQAFRLEWEMRDAAFEYLRATKGRPAGAGGDAPAPDVKPPDLEALRARLTDLADRRFAVAVQEKTLQIADMSDRLDRLRTELSRSAEDRPEKVRQQVESIIERLQRGIGPEPARGPRPDGGRPGGPPPHEGMGDGPPPAPRHD